MLFLGVLAWLPAQAGNWTADTHTLAYGDFNGDGKTDVLYIAHDMGGTSGIAISDGSGPNTHHQSWASNYLGIPWYQKLFVPVVGDFNGDGRDDLLLQASVPGDSYLFHADANGKFVAISQTIGYNHIGLNWSANEHKIIAGDFSGDGKDDLFLQGMRRDVLNAVVFADSYGQFGSGPAQTWGDSYLGFRWTAPSADIHVGDFNEDAKADLLVQAKPDIVMIDYEIPIPIPVYRPQSFGIVTAGAESGGLYFYAPVHQMWDRNHLGAEWSANLSNVVIGDFDGDGKADIFLQPKHSGSASLLIAHASTGQITAGSSLLDANVNSWTGNQYQLRAANFDGTAAVGLYLQAATSSSTNSIAATITGSTVYTSGHNPSFPTATTVSITGSSDGTYAVSQTGAALYTLPIWVPPGAMGLQPNLALTYSSDQIDGYLGPGWSLSLPSITYCPPTRAQDGSTVTGSTFCLNGQKLRMVSGAYYGVEDSVYHTELAEFSKVILRRTSLGGGAYRTWFEVWDKQGRTMEFGRTADANIQDYGSIVLAWALNKVSDRNGNHWKASYTATPGSYKPDKLQYTYTTANTAYPYEVSFSYEGDPGTDPDKVNSNDVYSGGQTVETNRISAITVRHDGHKVRDYRLTYETSPTTRRKRLVSMQECGYSATGGYSTPNCLPATQMTYQNGASGIAVPSTNIGIPYTRYIADLDGNGVEDLIYQQSGVWKVRFGTASGFESEKTAGSSSTPPGGGGGPHPDR